MLEIFSGINYGAVIVAAIVYWAFGAVWFSMLFGKLWAKLLERHGIRLRAPNKKEMTKKFISTFILNLILVFGLAFLVTALDLTMASSAIGLALLVAICFSLASMELGYLWENRPRKLILIELGYPFFGIIIASLILTFWR